MRVRSYILLLTLAVVLLVGLPPACNAAVYERALENPALLRDIGLGSLLYVGHSLGSHETIAAYGEYDPYLHGHGAVLIRGHWSSDTFSLGYLGSWGIERASLGLGLHRVSGQAGGSWSADLGVLYRTQAVTARLAITQLPLHRDLDDLGDSVVAVGASLALSSRMAVGIDAFVGDTIVYRPDLQLDLGSLIESRLYTVLEDNKWTAVGVEAVLSRGQLLVKGGYEVRRWNNHRFYFGVGVRY